MALQDRPIDTRHLRLRHLDFMLAVAAAATLGAAVTLQVVALVSDRSLMDAGVTGMLWVLAMLFTVAWLVVSFERRLVRDLHHIENSRYRDGYADGYLDAIEQAKNSHRYDRPQLRPVR
jgi:hypothetical protein